MFDFEKNTDLFWFFRFFSRTGSLCMFEWSRSFLYLRDICHLSRTDSVLPLLAFFPQCSLGMRTDTSWPPISPPFDSRAECAHIRYHPFPMCQSSLPFPPQHRPAHTRLGILHRRNGLRSISNMKLWESLPIVFSSFLFDLGCIWSLVPVTQHGSSSSA